VIIKEIMMAKYKRSSSSDQAAAEAYKVKPDEIIFEQKASRKGGRFQEHFITLYGAPKIGKSTFCMNFPNIYMLPTEPGYRWLKCRKTYIPNWATFRHFVQKVEDKPKFLRGVDLWSIDTTTNLSKFCMQWVCGREGIAHPTDQEWGKGWEAYGDEFMYWILRLAALGKGIIFVAHEKEKEIISRRIRLTKLSPNLPSTTGKFINAISNIILHIGYVEQSRDADELGVLRAIYTKPSETRDAGDQTGMLPDVIKFRTEKQAVRKILRCFE